MKAYFKLLEGGFLLPVPAKVQWMYLLKLIFLRGKPSGEKF